MTEHPTEAQLADTPAGKVPQGEGWFIVNVADAAGIRSQGFGSGCRFEGDASFEDFGINVRVLQPGEPASMYHAEDAQEAFLVLSGEAQLIVGAEQRPLGKGDFVHLPANTPHLLVGAGEGPSSVLMVGARPTDRQVLFTPNEAAAQYGASVDEETSDRQVAYQAARLLDPAPIGLPW